MGVNELDGVYVSGVPHYSPAGMRVWIVLCVSFTTTLSIIVVGLRILSRRIRKQPLWWDDYLIMFSMVTSPSSSLQKGYTGLTLTGVG